MRMHEQPELRHALSSTPLHTLQVGKTIWLIIGPVICVVMGFAMVVRLRPNENMLNDFVQEWTSARNWLQGDPIYEDLHRSVAQDIRPELVHVLPIRFNAHPPVCVLLTLPFGALPYHQAVVIWNVVSLAALGVSLVMILNAGGVGLPRWAWLPVVSLLLLSSPLGRQVAMAQLNLVLLLLFTLAWRLERTGHFAASGVCIGLAASVKVFPGFLFLYFLAQRRSTALATGFATLLLLNVFSLLMLGWPAWEDYFTVVMPTVANFFTAWENASITGFWAKLFDPSNPAVVPIFVAPELARSLTVLSELTLAATMCWAIYRANSPGKRDCAFAAGVVAAILLSPIVWQHYYVILTLPLLILWHQLSASKPIRFLLCCAIFLLAINPAWIAGADVSTYGQGGVVIQPTAAMPIKTLTTLSFQFYMLLLLWGLGCAGSFLLPVAMPGDVVGEDYKLTNDVYKTDIKRNP